jgi:hypothetical protein
MKPIIILSAMLLGTQLLTGQTNNKTATVRIKKVERINGVEKITDTTFETTDPHQLELNGGSSTFEEIIDKEGKKVKIMIIDGEKENGSPRIIIDGKEVDKQEAAGLRSIKDSDKGNEMIIINSKEDLSPEQQKEIEQKLESLNKDLEKLNGSLDQMNLTGKLDSLNI